MTGIYRITNNAKGIHRYTTTDVGSFRANRWGLYDMHGNVEEWCWDWYGPYNSGAQTDPVGASSGTGRVLRGGEWGNMKGGAGARSLRSAARYGFTPRYRSIAIGFRLVRP
jgi:formylglycine-generating enzyme required for sulfatase activity